MKREARYIVLKLKDIEGANLGGWAEDNFNKVCDAVSKYRQAQGKPPLCCVVVEADWPEYEAVWAMVEARVDGAVPGNNEPLDLHHVLVELAQARNKFPTWPTDAQDALAVVYEELGELQKDVLQMKYEPSKGKQLSDVRTEAIQTAAMALRFLFSLNKYTFVPGAQHKG